MAYALITYFAAATTALLALAAMILAIGKSISDCPQTGRAARAGSITIATGFVAIGAGAVILIAAALPTFDASPQATLAALGFICLILGLGFTHAVTTLRQVVDSARPATAAVTPDTPRAT